VPAVVLVLALAGYFLFIPHTVAQDGRLESLLVQRPGIAGLQPAAAYSNAVPIGPGDPPPLIVAYDASPTKTGSWSIDWTSTGKALSTSEASIVLDQMPTVAAARTLRPQLDAEFVEKSSYTSAGFTEDGTFGLPRGIAKGVTTTGATYRRAKSKNEPAATRALVSFQYGRAVVVLSNQAPGQTQSGATQLAEAELALLRKNEPSFQLGGSQYPLLSSILWWLVALAVVAACLVVPKLAIAARDRRRAHAEAMARSQFQMRGQKVLKRRGSGRRPAPGRTRR
jgi:hypothetical protein